MLELMIRAAKVDPRGGTRPTIQKTRVLPRIDSLRRLGFAVEHFPHFVHPRPKQHEVDVVLLTCVTRGRAIHIMGDRRFEVGPGSCGITHYGQLHDLVTGPEGVEVFNLYLDLERNAPPVLPHPLQGTLSAILSPHPTLVHRHNSRIQVDFSSPESARAALARIAVEQVTRGPGWESAARHALLLLLIDLCRAVRDRGHDAPTAVTRPDWLPRVVRAIDDRFDEPLSLADLSRIAGVRTEHLCRAFRRATGQSPLRYVRDRRIRAALWLLRTEAAPISSIALDVGFNDLSTFNRHFRQITGDTPTRYRARFRPSRPAGGSADRSPSSDAAHF